MSDYFARLETELQAAAERRPRRIAGLTAAARWSVTALAAGSLLALALLATVALLGGGDRPGGRATQEQDDPPRPAPIGTVIPKGEGNPPRESDSTVVATGTAPVTGPWQLEVFRGSGVKDPTTGQVYLRAGGACLVLAALDPPDPLAGGRGGYCGPTQDLGFRKTPGFSRQQLQPVTRRAGRPVQVNEVLVFGVVPDRAAAVVITVDGRKRFEVKPQEGPKTIRGNFYVIPVKPGLGKARVNWIDRDGKAGSRGIALMPPVTDS